MLTDDREIAYNRIQVGKEWGLSAVQENWQEIAHAADILGGEQWLPRFMFGLHGKKGLKTFEPLPLLPAPAELTTDIFKGAHEALVTSDPGLSVFLDEELERSIVVPSASAL